jgi:hypothetical protein
MPVRDHFHPPLLRRPPWATLHGLWIGHLTANLNRRWLPAGYRAELETRFGPDAEPDVCVVREPQAAYPPALDPGEPAPAYAVPEPDATVAGVAAPQVRTLVYNVEGRLVGAVELVSPANKDRPEKRDGFAARIQAYLQSEVSLVLADIVTEYRHCLHNRWAELFGAGAPRLPEEGARSLYAAAYRPWTDRSGDRREPKLDLWLRPLAVGDELPVLPLFLSADLAVPVELELTYTQACGDIRLPEAA